MRIHLRSRPVGFACSLALSLLVASSALGQAGSTSSDSAARFVPKDKLISYMEFDGLDAHADGWKKTAAYKILNDTPTGSMLEDLGTQLAGKLPAYGMTGPEVVSLFKHLARSGFVLASGGEPSKPETAFSVFVIRDGYKNKDVRPILNKFLQGRNFAGTKRKEEMKAGHKIVTGTSGPGGTGAFGWWVEKSDIVYVSGGTNAAVPIVEALDGKRPSVLDHPQYKEMTAAEPGFEQLALSFDDGSTYKNPMVPEAMGLSEIKRVESRWGFSDKALMTITRIVAPSPRKGMLAMIDGPSLDKSSLPPLHEALTAFTVVAFDAKAALTKLAEILKAVYPPGEQQLNQAIDGIKAKTKLRLKEDILPHFGPRAAFFELPSKVGSAPTLPPPGLMTMMLGAMGRTQVPKGVILVDIDSPVAVGKILDELTTSFNREMKAQAKAAASANKGEAPSPMLFSQVTGESKTYVLNLPKEQAKLFGATFKPAIRVGPKQIAIAINAETARLALEPKLTWAPPASLATGFQTLPSKLKYLGLTDPKETTPAILAALPGKLQEAINTIILAMMPPAAPGVVAAAPVPEARPGGGLRPSAAPMVGGGGGGAPAPGAGAGAAKPATNGIANPNGTIVLQVDPSRMPSADSIKALMFPTLVAVEANDEGIKIISRQAFFEFPDPSLISGMVKLGKGAFKDGKFDPTGLFSGVPGIPGMPGINPAVPGAPATPGSRGAGVSAGRPD